MYLLELEEYWEPEGENGKNFQGNISHEPCTEDSRYIIALFRKGCPSRN